MDALAKVGAWSLLGVAVLWVFTALPNSAGMLEIAQGATFLGGLALAGAARNSSFREKVAEEIRTEVSPFFSAEYKGLVNKTAIIYCVYAAIESAYGCAFW